MKDENFLKSYEIKGIFELALEDREYRLNNKDRIQKEYEEAWHKATTNDDLMDTIRFYN